MDDITNKRFDRVERRIDGVEERIGHLKADVAAVKTELSGKLDNVAAGLQAALDAGFRAASVQLSRIEAVTESQRDRKVAELEATVTDLRERLARLEQVLAGGGKQ